MQAETVLPETADPAPQPSDAEYQAILQHMLAAGDKIVADLAAEDISAAQKAEPYERLTRGVRRTIVLARHIAQNPHQPAERPADPAKSKLAAERRRVAREIDDDILRKHGDTPRAESFRQELRERLDDPALDLAITHLGVGAAIANIRRDLGFANTGPNPFWPRRTPDQVRALDQFAAPGGPIPQPAAPPLYTDDPDAEHEPDDDGEPGHDPHPILAALLRRHAAVRDG